MSGRPLAVGTRHFKIRHLIRLSPVAQLGYHLNWLSKEGHTVQITSEKIESLLSSLDSSVPRLLRENQGMEFWIEYLQRADAIKDQVGFHNHDWVATRIDEIPMKYGVRPPSRWMYS